MQSIMTSARALTLFATLASLALGCSAPIGDAGSVDEAGWKGDTKANKNGDYVAPTFEQLRAMYATAREAMMSKEQVDNLAFLNDGNGPAAQGQLLSDHRWASYAKYLQRHAEVDPNDDVDPFEEYDKLASIVCDVLADGFEEPSRAAARVICMFEQEVGFLQMVGTFYEGVETSALGAPVHPQGHPKLGLVLDDGGFQAWADERFRALGKEDQEAINEATEHFEDGGFPYLSVEERMTTLFGKLCTAALTARKAADASFGFDDETVRDCMSSGIRPVFTRMAQFPEYFGPYPYEQATAEAAQ